MRENMIRTRWNEGRCATLGWLAIPNAFTAEVMARQGFDALCVDMQHGLIDYGDLWPMLQAVSQTSTTPIVRVPSHEPGLLMKVLDAGAYGVVVPLVNDAAEAAAVVSVCRYPPVGTRSIGPIRAMHYAGPDYPARANDEILVLAMIETRAGLDAVDEIAAVHGLDGLYIGPNDLAYALGLQPTGTDSEDPVHLAACDRILQAAHRHGKRAVMHCYSGGFAARAAARGFDMVMLGSDLGCLTGGVKKLLGDWKAGTTG
jgi:4-hydroxy-2-oxoheptanedioate aldolase